MKKIIVLGANGMAGHVVYNYLSSFRKFKVYNTARTQYKDDTIIMRVGTPEVDKVIEFIKKEKIDYVINCIGLLLPACKGNFQEALMINTLFPHILERHFKIFTPYSNTKLIHLSTDCVFSGQKGLYSATDEPDGTGEYATTKIGGEVVNTKDLTIRMSIIGKELKTNGTGLFHWFMKQTGTIKGYTGALWSGMTTLELAKAIERIISTKPELSGLYQLAPDYSISKYDLLKLIQIIWKKHDVTIEPYDGKVCNKILINSRDKGFKYKFPVFYEQMLQNYYDYLKENKR